MLAEIHNAITAKRSHSPVDATADAVGVIVDLQGYEGCVWLIASGVLTGGGFTPLVEHGNDPGLSDVAAVVDADLLPSGTGQEAAAAFTSAGTDDNQVRKIGYRGNKRYVRLTLTETGTVTVGLISSICVLFRSARVPAAQPTA